MLPNLIWLSVGTEHGRATWVYGLIIPLLLLIFLFAALGKKIWLACLLLAPFATLAPAEAFYIDTYLHPTNAEILATLAATNPRETYEYLGSWLIPGAICIVASLMLALLAARWAWRAGIRWQHRSRDWVVLAAVSVALVATAALIAIPSRLHPGDRMITELSTSIEPGYPFGLIPRIVHYQREWHQLETDAKSLGAFRFHAHLASTTQQRQIYVLVIGESSRRDHWQLFGYGRPTNPELSKISNLVLIPHMLTAWPISIMAIPLLLTRKPIIDSQIGWNEASILRAMQEAGFDTWWISNQLPMGKYDSPVSTYALEANHTIFLNHASLSDAGSLDEVLLKPLHHVIHHTQGNLFIVLHMMGSHLYYDTRYPAAFKKFTPVFSDKGTHVLPRIRFQNSYDNTILYTDYVLAGIIKILRDDHSISTLIYASDHGESLPTSTCSKYGHGNGTRPEFQIPALFWYSDSYAEKFPARLSALRSNASKPTMSADMFESIIDMAGIDFSGHDPRRSLFSTQWQYRPRMVSPIWQVDFDKAVFSKKCEIVLPPGADTNH
jgi:Predicted membrane-associated, metal-dependent hydrolase